MINQFILLARKTMTPFGSNHSCVFLGSLVLSFENNGRVNPLRVCYLSFTRSKVSVSPTFMSDKTKPFVFHPFLSSFRGSCPYR